MERVTRTSRIRRGLAGNGRRDANFRRHECLHLWRRTQPELLPEEVPERVVVVEGVREIALGDVGCDQQSMCALAEWIHTHERQATFLGMREIARPQQVTGETLQSVELQDSQALTFDPDPLLSPAG
jgi:hypothetical protein